MRRLGRALIGRSGPAMAGIAVVLSVLVFGLWYQNRHPREIIGSGSVRVVRTNGTAATHATRTVSINGAVFQEVALPNGTWVECGGGDCARAAREAVESFWQLQDQTRR